jgi:hypothetical protein
MCFRVAMLSLHTSPLAQLGKSLEAGGMNVYVRELSRELGKRGLLVDIFTRWTDPTTPRILLLATTRASSTSKLAPWPDCPKTISSSTFQNLCVGCSSSPNASSTTMP